MQNFKRFWPAVLILQTKISFATKNNFVKNSVRHTHAFPVVTLISHSRAKNSKQRKRIKSNCYTL